MKRKKNQKISKKKGVIGDYTIQIILLAIGFVVVLFLFSFFYFIPASDKNACHFSVVSRSSIKTAFVDSAEIVPLNCKTEKICLSLSGEDCVEVSDTRDNKVKKVKLSECTDETCFEAREQVLEAIADSMVRCHSMLGEGQLNFFPTKNAGFGETVYGLICSRVVFDDAAKNLLSPIGAGEFYGYLERQVTKDQSYLSYIYKDWENSRNIVDVFGNFQEKNGLGGTNFVDWKVIDFTQENGYAIIASIAERDQGWATAGALGAAVLVPAGIGLIASGIGAPAGIVLLGGASAVSGGAVFWYNYNDEYHYSPPSIYAYDLEVLRRLGIYSFEIAP